MHAGLNGFVARGAVHRNHALTRTCGRAYSYGPRLTGESIAYFLGIFPDTLELLLLDLGILGSTERSPTAGQEQRREFHKRQSALDQIAFDIRVLERLFTAPPHLILPLSAQSLHSVSCADLYSGTTA